MREKASLSGDYFTPYVARYIRPSPHTYITKPSVGRRRRFIPVLAPFVWARYINSCKSSMPYLDRLVEAGIRAERERVREFARNDHHHQLQ